MRAPKLYLRDSGLLHLLLDLGDREALERHPKVGASWEGFVLEQLVAQLGVESSSLFFWATHQGAELDLLVVAGRSRLGFEVKRTMAPALTRSMQIALADLELDRLDVLYPGTEEFPLAPRVRAVPAEQLLASAEPPGAKPRTRR